MLRKTGFALLLLTICYHFVTAAPVSVNTPLLIKILQMQEQKQRDRQLIAQIKDIFVNIPITDQSKVKAEMHGFFKQYRLEGAPAFESFIESVCLQRSGDWAGCENALIKSIVLAKQVPDHYLRYSLYSHLAFFQTYRGNTIDAVSNFGMANKEAITLNDADLQVVVDINISDIYYKNSFYSQSLLYLKRADSLMGSHLTADNRLQNIVYFNKAEIYFRIGYTDSLRKYNTLLNDKKRGNYKIYGYRQRTDYFLSIIIGDYHAAISRIKRLRKDPLYKSDDDDLKYLAEAYTRASMPDSAKGVINQLLVDKPQNNHPEVKYHLYEMLGEAGEKQNDNKQAAIAYKLALQQLEEEVNRLSQVGNISSQIKIDEVEGAFIKKQDALLQQRLWLIFIIIVSALIIIIVAILYRNNKQKRFYEKLLYDSKKEELSFINSHEVRRHLANILGIIQVIKNSDDTHKDYIQAQEHLLSAAESLDEAIKNISDKLAD